MIYQIEKSKYTSENYFTNILPYKKFFIIEIRMLNLTLIEDMFIKSLVLNK